MRQSTTRPAWILAIVAAALFTLMLAACQPVSEPVTVAQRPLPAPAADWQRISDAGVMVVGVSVDYPPFEYYNESFQIDGFDPALMQAIGQQLGIDIRFVDLAFDGVSQALALGQVDAVISALSETPERARIMDFSTPYFVSSDAYLVDPAAPLTITSLEDLRDLRVAVELGSIYEDQVQGSLVDSGLIPPRNLIRYTAIADAVRDLAKERVDVVVLDLPAAERFVETGSASLAGQGLSEQRFAIAVRKDSAELRAQINQALSNLLARGVAARLAEQYLGVPVAEFPTLPTDAIPAAETGAAPDCLDAMAWVASLSYDDQEMMAPPVMFPGQPFTKSWRVENIGTCTWDSSYYIEFARGNAPGAGMGGAPVNIRGAVAPGETYDLSVNLVAPLLPGVYQAFWEMRNGDGRAFGQTLRAGVQVAGAPTPTPAPTATPVPGVVFYADMTRVTRGQPVTFVWDVQDAQAVYFFQDGDDWQGNSVEPGDQQTVYPDRTGAYKLRVERSDGSVDVRSITVEVLQGDGAYIESFAVVPNDDVALGACVDISWHVVGEDAAVTLTRDDVELWDAAPLEGHIEDCPSATGEVVYTITASDAAGMDTRQQDVRVVEATAMRTPADDAPNIDIFAVTPETIALNGCVVVSWNVGGDVKTIDILRNDVVILDSAPLTGSGQNCLTEVGDYRYRLVATSSTGATSSAEVTVTVALAPEATAPAGAAVDPVLTGKTWVLTALTDGVSDMISPLASSQVTAEFGEDSQLTGSAGCNSYNSAYSAAEGVMTIGPAVSTRKFCAEPAGVMDQEAIYLALLPGAAAYTVENGELTLLNGVGQPIAVFVAGQ
jgi:polar amino acid transport system substrate-binding protein